MLVLIWAGAATRDGFEAMVAYGLPVFWTFLLLTGVTLFVFRAKSSESPVFRVPLYPVVPIVFLTTGADIGWIERAFESRWWNAPGRYRITADGQLVRGGPGTFTIPSVAAARPPAAIRWRPTPPSSSSASPTAARSW